MCQIIGNGAFFFTIAVLVVSGITFCRATESSSDTVLAVLLQEDPAPSGMKSLGTDRLTGDDYSDSCAYYQLLLQGERIARDKGANVLKIVKRYNHTAGRQCDEVDVAFYKADDPRKVEQSFSWNAKRPLTWDDFLGPVREEAGSQVAAETSCGIALETNLVTNSGIARVYVFNTFDKRKSWVRPGKKFADILAHEQVHWNICELYTRKMQALFDQTAITGASLSSIVNEIYNKVSKEYIARQQQYEEETQHGTIEPAQQAWILAIQKELEL